MSNTNRTVHSFKELAYFANVAGLSFVVVLDPEEGTKLLFGSKGNRFYPNDFNARILSNPRHRWATVRLSRKLNRPLSAKLQRKLYPEWFSAS